MKVRISLLLAASLLISGAAQSAPLLAGWDFSQWGSGITNPNTGTGRQSVLKSNYSDLDTDPIQVTGDLFPGLGYYSADQGTLYINGQYGSYTTPASGSLPLRNIVNNINLNTNGSTGPGGAVILMGDASAGNGLQYAEGPPASQQFFNANRFGAGAPPSGFTGTLDAVFALNLTDVVANSIRMSFAGVTNSSTSPLNVQWSADGASYTSLNLFNLTSTPDVYTTDTLNLPSAVSQLFFRVQFQGSNPILPTIDNVQIRADSVTAIPEPGTLLLLASGLGGLAVMGRRRA